MRERAGCQAGQAHGRASVGRICLEQRLRWRWQTTEGLRQELRLPGWVPRCQG